MMLIAFVPISGRGSLIGSQCSNFLSLSSTAFRTSSRYLLSGFTPTMTKVVYTFWSPNWRAAFAWSVRFLEPTTVWHSIQTFDSSVPSRKMSGLGNLPQGVNVRLGDVGGLFLSEGTMGSSKSTQTLRISQRLAARE